MKVSLIVAVSENGVIGHENRLLWNIPEDLQRFRRLTMGHHIIMGRKTFASIGRVLKGRTSIVLTRTLSLRQKNCVTMDSLEKALEHCHQKQEDEAFIIGGNSVFNEALRLGLPNTIYLTRVHRDYQGDTFFPEIDTSKYHLKDIEKREGYSFIDYERIG